MEAFIGTILPWAGNYAPVGWLLCQGQKLPISNYQALYAVIGAMYGGDGTTFCLPNLQGRVPVGAGALPGTSISFQQGATGGAVSANLPKHTHTASITDLNINASFALRASTDLSSATAPPADAETAANYGLAKVDGSGVGGDVTIYKDISNDGNSVVKLKSFPCDVTSSGGTVTVNPAGSGTSETFPVMQPYQVINYIICYNGNFPMRD